MEFEKRKAATLSALSQSGTDKSPKGSLDIPILPLLNSINHHPDYFTTSSCSGRVSILSTPFTSPTPNKKAKGGHWLYLSHSLAQKTQILRLLFDEKEVKEEEVVFRFEPLIVAVECRHVEAGERLVGWAVGSGFRESGMMIGGGGVKGRRRVMVGVRCSIRMEVPLGERGRVLVGREYVGFLVDRANEKMEANWRRTDAFFQTLLANGFAEVGEVGKGLEMSEVGDVESKIEAERVDVVGKISVVLFE